MKSSDKIYFLAGLITILIITQTITVLYFIMYDPKIARFLGMAAGLLVVIMLIINFTQKILRSMLRADKKQVEEEIIYQQQVTEE